MDGPEVELEGTFGPRGLVWRSWESRFFGSKACRLFSASLVPIWLEVDSAKSVTNSDIYRQFFHCQSCCESFGSKAALQVLSDGTRKSWDGQEGFFWPLLGGRIAQRCWCPMCPVSEDHGSSDKSCEECKSNSVIWKKLTSVMCSAFFCPTFCLAALHILGASGISECALPMTKRSTVLQLYLLGLGHFAVRNHCESEALLVCSRALLFSWCKVRSWIRFFKQSWLGILQSSASWHQRLIWI